MSLSKTKSNLFFLRAIGKAQFLLASLVVLFVFLSNWSLLDGAPRNSLSAMLSGEADRPYVYRQLLPSLVNHVEPSLPEVISDFLAADVAPLLYRQFTEPLINRYETIVPNLRDRATQDWSQKPYRIKYVLTVTLMLVSLWATLNILGLIASAVGASKPVRLLGPVVYALLLPLTFLNGGYFYDFTEQFFVSLLLLAALRRNWLLWFLVAIAGQLNKETMLMAPFFLAPIIVYNAGLIRALLLVCATTAICFLLYLAVKDHFYLNPGVVMQYNLADNLAFWLTPANYAQFTDMYTIGFPLPRITFCLVIIGVMVYSVHAPLPALLSSSIALAVLVPLFIVLGSRDEFRALGQAFPLFYLVAVSPRELRKKASSNVVVGDL